MWKGCERTVFGLPELGFRCLAFSDPLPTSFIFVSVQVRLLTCYGPLPVSCNGFEAAVSAACGRVANALFLACLSLDLGAVWPFRIRCQRASFLSLCRLGCLPLRSFTCLFSRFRSCSFGSVWKGCERTVFGLPELGFRWSLALSHPLPPSFIFVSVQVRFHLLRSFTCLS